MPDWIAPKETFPNENRISARCAALIAAAERKHALAEPGEVMALAERFKAWIMRPHVRPDDS